MKRQEMYLQAEHTRNVMFTSLSLKKQTKQRDLSLLNDDVTMSFYVMMMLFCGMLCIKRFVEEWCIIYLSIIIWHYINPPN